MLEVVLDFLSQGRHMRVDRPVCHVDVLAPDMLQEIVASNDLAGPLEE